MVNTAIIVGDTASRTETYADCSAGIFSLLAMQEAFYLDYIAKIAFTLATLSSILLAARS